MKNKYIILYNGIFFKSSSGQLTAVEIELSDSNTQIKQKIKEGGKEINISDLDQSWKQRIRIIPYKSTWVKNNKYIKNLF